MTQYNDGELVPRGLPKSADLIREGHERSRVITPAITNYARERGVRTERFFKERCRDERKITYYVNLGLKSWPETRDALNTISDECRRRDLQFDRVSLTADRRMGLMPEARAAAVEETGIMFWTPEDWAGVARDVEVQGIINDHTVGSPASVHNAAAAIGAGIAYIGNLAQQCYGYPGWASDSDQMINTLIAIAMIAEKRDHGIVLDSYIDDGYCASFHDAATSLGWCLLHRYIAEDLVGAAYSPSYGSTMSDPVLKAAFGRALDAINTSRVPPSFIHGDTNTLDPAYSLDRHAAMVTSDVFFAIANELNHPTGAAVHATPLTEPVRVPTVEDIIQSLEIANEAERQARQALPLIDWRPVNALRDKIVKGGRQVYANMMSGPGLARGQHRRPAGAACCDQAIGCEPDRGALRSRRAGHVLSARVRASRPDRHAPASSPAPSGGHGRGPSYGARPAAFGDHDRCRVRRCARVRPPRPRARTQ